MKKAVSFILLITFCAQTFYTTGLNFWFYLNQTHLAEQFCINKAKPKLHCNGHCYLSKKMEKAEKETQEKADELYKQWIFCKVSTSIQTSCYACSHTETKNYLPFKSSFYKNLSVFNIFHPPVLS